MVERICVWCPVIVFIFIGFGLVGAKRCGGCLKVISWGWWCKSQKGALLIGKAGSHYVILLSCETLLQVLLGIYCKRFYRIPLFTILLFYVFEVGKAKSATQSFLMVLTLNSVSLTLPLPLVCFFPHYNSVCTVISDCNHPFDTSTFTHSLTRIHLLQLKIHI